MDMIAEGVWDSRERTFVEKIDGEDVMHTTAIAHLGGATLDKRRKLPDQKTVAAGLGMVCISNQARIWHSSTVPGLGTSFGRGGATTALPDLVRC